MLNIGEYVENKYRILEVIDHGGMSTVYKAINERANKIWAIKELRQSNDKSYQIIKQGLIAETTILKNLKHSGIPSISDVIDKDDAFLVVMDYIEGRTLKDIVEEKGSISEEMALCYALQLCDILKYLHNLSPPIIYRDLKPGNIMVDNNDHIVLFDFGTARYYKIGKEDDTVSLGTRGYAAPEQYEGRGQTDERTDIYGMGITLYHVLTGRNPSYQSFALHPVREIVPYVSPGMEKIISKCTRDSPADRYQNIKQLEFDLNNYHKLDQKYIKCKKREVRLFFLPLILSFIFLISVFISDYYEKSIKQFLYDSYVSQAEISEDYEEIKSLYQQAITLKPECETAYMSALNTLCYRDNAFSDEESSLLIGLLMDPVKRNTAAQDIFLEDNREKYDEFSYELGKAFYYYYEFQSNKTFAVRYMDLARQSDFLSDNKKLRAQRIYEISSNYMLIGAEDLSGDNSYSYVDYWKALCDLSSGNIVKEDNENTAFVMYEEIVRQIIENIEGFKDEGLEKSEISRKLRDINKHLEDDFNKSNVRTKERLDELMDNLYLAEKMLDSVYGMD